MFVYIVESPSPKDFLVSRAEGHILFEALKLFGIDAHYCIAVDDKSLKQALSVGLGELSTRLRKVPIIHLSAHGSDQGIELTSHEFVTWKQLASYLLSVSPPELRAGLLLCLCSCEGLSGIKMAMAEDPPPFFGVVGPTEAIDWYDGLVAFITFYHLLFNKNKLPDEAAKQMESSSGSCPFKAILASSAQRAYLERLQEYRLSHLSQSGTASQTQPSSPPS